jgi:hypothetical protein
MPGGDKFVSDAGTAPYAIAENAAKLYLNSEVFNVANNWSATGYNSSRAYQEAKGVITATPNLLYLPSAAAGFPNGTQARRMQLSMRVEF